MGQGISPLNCEVDYNFILSLDRTNLRFQISDSLRGVREDFVKGKIFLHFFGQRLGFEGRGVI